VKEYKVNTESGRKPALSSADRNVLRGLILKGRSFDDILKELGGRAQMHHIYGMRSAMKKEGIELPKGG